MKSTPEAVKPSAAPPITEFTPQTVVTDLRQIYDLETRSLPLWLNLRCQACGQTFQRRRSHVTPALRKRSKVILCTTECGRGRTNVTLTCTQCSAPFTKPQWYINKYAPEFCSPACASRAQRRGEHPCPGCGDTVLTSQKVYCSGACRSRNAWVELTCKQCQQPFRIARAEAMKKERAGKPSKYCSTKCTGDAHAHNRGAKCERCRTVMPRSRGRRFCSRECRRGEVGEAWNRVMPGENGMKGSAIRLRPVFCPQCGLYFNPKNSRRTYCSRACAGRAHAVRMRGPGNSRYKDGTSYANLFRKMRAVVIERDNHHCVACRSPEKPITFIRNGKTASRTNFHVHHINEDVKDNRPENLITLCGTCHSVHHHSETTPFPWFATYATSASRSMTSKLKETATSLLTKYSSTTAP